MTGIPTFGGEFERRSRASGALFAHYEPNSEGLSLEFLINRTKITMIRESEIACRMERVQSLHLLSRPFVPYTTRSTPDVRLDEVMKGLSLWIVQDLSHSLTMVRAERRMRERRRSLGDH